jgi:hypothetical protein
MDLTLEDFNKAFLDTEVSKVELKTMGGRVIYLRALSRANVVRFRAMAEEMNTKLALNIFANLPKAKRLRENDLDAAEDFLVIKTICDSEGTLLFDEDLKKYKDWSNNVSNQVIDEILHFINDTMQVFFDPEEEEKDRKKK